MTTETLELHTFSTPHSNPVRFHVRAGTSDWNTCNAISGIGDEYHLPEGLTGWALDVGAHIGAATVCLLVDNPHLRVVAVEALPENVEMLRRNLQENGVSSRCVVIQGAASDSDAPVRIGYGADGVHDYIGNMAAPEGNREVFAPGVTLGYLLLDAITDGLIGNPSRRFVWAKIDCEGCEGPFFEGGLVGQIDHIEGEVHPECGGERLKRILEQTHDVTFPGWDANPDFGPFIAVRR